MMNYKVSIIVPLYNVGSYIKSCIDSVIQQDMDDAVQIIMVDDGSSDDSLAIAKGLALEYHTITVISQENKGLGGARNTGLLNAEGEYVLFLDADDVLAANSLSKLIEIADQNQAEILEFSAKGINAEGQTVYHISNKTTSPKNGRAYYLAVRYMNSACNKLYHLNFLKKYHLFFKERIFIEDFEFNTRVFANAERVVATDLVGAYFLQTPLSITRNNDASKITKMQSDISQVIKITADLRDQYEGKAYHSFFSERLSFLTTTLFYQLFKRRASYDEVIKLKKELISQNQFFCDHPIFDKKKNLFRMIILKNLSIYPLLIRLIR